MAAIAVDFVSGNGIIHFEMFFHPLPDMCPNL